MTAPKPTLLPYDAPFKAYAEQAQQLHRAVTVRSPEALSTVLAHHPQYRHPDIPWLLRDSDPSEVVVSPFSVDDAQLVVARLHQFRDWEALETYAALASDHDSPVYRFESAVEDLVAGHEKGLARWLERDPALVTARSIRVMPHDPPAHRATLLHYVAANGVEGYRQKSPSNAVAMARLLLDAGADANALADLYGGGCTTLSLLVSSVHPAAAGVQVPLVDLLVDYGASVERVGQGNWTSPLLTALVFGYVDAAEALVRRGARVDSIVASAGLGRLAEVEALLTTSTDEERHRALALAAALGRTEVVRRLLDAGEDPDRLNPKAMHQHSTPLHQAVANGHLDTVRLLVERGARTDIADSVWNGTALGWADHLKETKIAEYLRSVAR